MARLELAVEGETGTDWAYVVSPEVGLGGAAEYYAFIYKTNTVTLLTGPTGVYPEASSLDFSREPYFATFKSGDFDFTLATVHITWGDSTAERVAEVERLDDVYNYIQGLSSSENDILICGDFNLDGPGHYAFSDLASAGCSWLVDDGPGVFTTYSTLQDTIGANFYDNIWSSSDCLSHFTGESGVYYTYQNFFLTEPYPHLSVRTQLSDHCPVWARFNR